MQLIAPELFAEVSRLSVGACAIGIALGVLIWLTGWWQHRFWAVVAFTAGAGIYGLQQGRAGGSQPLVVGLLAALSAGFMAVELAKLLAFFGGGAVGSFLVQNFVPNLHEPLISFLAGGLLGIVLFRVWMLVLTSLIGTLIALYAGLGLGEHLLKADMAALVAQRPGTLNLAVCAGVLLGVLVQGRFDSWKSTGVDRRKAKAMKTLSDAERDALKNVKTRGPLLRLIMPKKAG